MAGKEYFRVQRSRHSQKGKVGLRQTAVIGKLKTKTETGATSPLEDAEILKRTYVWEFRNAQSAQTGSKSNYSPSPVFDERGTWRNQAKKLRELRIDPGQYVRVLMHELRSKVLFSDMGIAASRHKKKRAAKDIAAALHGQKESTKTVYVGLETWTQYRPPTPSQLTGRQYLKMFRHAMKRASDEAELQLCRQADKAETEAVYAMDFPESDRDDAILYVLSLIDPELTPLFCYCLAVSEIVVPEQSAKEKRRNDRFREAAKVFFKKACVQYLHNEAGYKAAWGKYLPPTLVRDAEAVFAEQLKRVKY